MRIYAITNFPDHPFKVKMDDKMLETIESVRDHGVLVPALVREKPIGGYEMISGHRRKWHVSWQEEIKFLVL